MAKIKSEKVKTPSAKKQAHDQIVKQLTAALPGLKDILGEKKFESRIKKAAKLLSAGVKVKKAKKKKTVLPVEQAS